MSTVRTAPDELEDDETLTPAPAFRPGYCSDHPTQRLVTHHAANKKGRTRWYGSGVDPATVCILCPVEPADRDERCRWCGGPLFPELPPVPYWQRSTRRVFCTPNHRLRAHRARVA